MSKTRKPLEVGANLKLARLAAGLTQDQAGRRLGISGQSIAGWECGYVRPPPNRLIALAELYDTTPRALGFDEAWLQSRRIRNSALARNLKSAREAAGLTLEEVSQELGLAKQSVWNWEACRYNPTRNQLIAVAELCLSRARQREQKAAAYVEVLLKLADEW
jgi:transcriptional regulator with XRE-family HTH domain